MRILSSAPAASVARSPPSRPVATSSSTSSMADYDLGRAREGRGRRRPLLGRPGRRLRRRVGRSPARGEHWITHVMNAVDPRFVMPIFDGRSPPAARTTSTWRCPCRSRTPSAPYEECGVKLGDEQFAMAAEWEEAGRLALVRHRRGARAVRRVRPLRRRPPVLPDRRARHPRRGRPEVRDDGYDFAPSFSIWTTIEECLNPPVIWEEGAGLVHHRAVQRAGGVRLPRGDRAGRVRERRARGGAPRAALGRLPSGSPSSTASARSSSTSSGRSTSSASTGRRRCTGRAGRRGVTARRGGGLPARPGRPRRPDAGQDLRRAPG